EKLDVADVDAGVEAGGFFRIGEGEGLAGPLEGGFPAALVGVPTRELGGGPSASGELLRDTPAGLAEGLLVGEDARLDERLEKDLVPSVGAFDERAGEEDAQDGLALLQTGLDFRIGRFGFENLGEGTADDPWFCPHHGGEGLDALGGE